LAATFAPPSIAQQQGTKLDTALQENRGVHGDLRFLMAQIIRQQCF
jgi:hypothetical protein